MIYLYLLGVLFAVMSVLWLWIVSITTKRATRSFGNPTPDEARIRQDTLDSIAAVKAASEREAQEVANASTDDLLVDLKHEVRGKK